MNSRALGLLAAASLAIVPVPSLAQDRTPTSDTPVIADQGEGDLLLMMGAIVLAFLLTLGATQLGGGDAPASP